MLQDTLFSEKAGTRESQLLLCREWQADPNIHMDIQGSQNRQHYLEKEQTGGLTLPDSKLTTKQQ
jgi:hypothetical protein